MIAGKIAFLINFLCDYVLLSMVAFNSKDQPGFLEKFTWVHNFIKIRPQKPIAML